MPTLPRVSAFALCLSALLVACGGSTTNTPGSCTSSANCTAGLVCTQGQCLAPGQCPSTVTSCVTNDQCPASSECASGCCQAVVGCSTSADCTDPSRPHCDTASHSCKPCASSAQCASNETCTSTGRCEPICASDADCKDASKPKCRLSGGLDYCAECNVSADCKDSSKPVCQDGACFGCTSNASCAAPTPACDTATKSCVTCVDAQNVNGTNPVCTTSGKPACVNKACVACAPSANANGSHLNPACSGSTPACNSSNQCVGCVDNNDCNGGVCNAGTCTVVSLAGFTSSSNTVAVDGTVTLTITLNVQPASSSTVAVSIKAGTGTLSANSVVISGGKTGTLTYTAPSTAGNVTLNATLGSGAGIDLPLTISDAPIQLASITPASSTIQAGQTTQLAAHLTAQPPADAQVTLVSDSASVTVPGSVTVAGGAAGSDTASFTVNGVSAGTATITGNYGVDKTATVTVFTVSVASVTTPSGDQNQGSDVSVTVNLVSAPPADALVDVSVDNGATIGSATTSTITVASGTTSKAFTVHLGTTGPVTVTASANGSTQTGSIALSATLPKVTSVVAASSGPYAECSAVPVIITLDKPATGNGLDVQLLSSIQFNTAFKAAAYMPSTVTVAAGTTTATTTMNDCKNTGSSGATDTANVTAYVQGSDPQGTNLLFSGRVTGTNPTAHVPPLPIALDHPLTYTAGTTTAPLPLFMTIGFLDKAPTGQTNSIAIAFSPAGCGSLSTSSTSNVTTATFAAGATNKQNYAFIPGSTPGLCTITFTPTVNGTVQTARIYQSLINLVAQPAAITPTDLILTKMEIDSGSADASTSTGSVTGKEYVEIFNPTANAIDTTGYKVVFVGALYDNFDGSSASSSTNTGKSQYNVVDLGSLAGHSIPAGGYLIVQDAGLTFSPALPSGTQTINIPNITPTNASDGNIHDAPGGIFIVKSTGIVDGATYGGGLVNATSALINPSGNNLFSWPPPGTKPLAGWVTDQFAVSGSLVRVGTTGKPSLDWRFSTTVKPGLPNTGVTAF
ncbi:MAG: hypothetical protein JST92_23735 [Deltaproteobacteria bacterium]|nr:hypothetical protein [Deltaproteobacteria bacterium]